MLHRVAPLLLILASTALAGPLPKEAIPEETRWIIHANVDAARGSALWKVLAERLVKPREAQFAPKIQALEMVTGTSLASTLHDFTLFGTSFDETTVCILIHAGVDQNRIIGFLKNDPEFNTQEHNGHTVYSWRDKGRDRLMYATFAANDMIILAPAPKLVFLTLDTLDSKSPALKADSPLLPPPATVADKLDAMATEPLLWIASIDLSELPRAQDASRVLLQLSHASIAVNANEEKVFVHVYIATSAENVARQLASAAEGIKSVVFLQDDDHARPLIKLGASILQNLSIVSEGKNLMADLSISSVQLDALAQVIFQPESTAATEPHTAALPDGPH